MSKPRDKKIVAHMRNLEAAAQSRDIEAFGKALLTVRKDATLTPAQFGAIAKTIAQEQAATYYQVMTGKSWIDMANAQAEAAAKEETK